MNDLVYKSKIEVEEAELLLQLLINSLCEGFSVDERNFQTSELKLILNRIKQIRQNINSLINGLGND